MTPEQQPTGFRANPPWKRWLWRQWRIRVLCRLPGKGGMRYIVPPREISQERMDAAIRRGRELARRFGW